MSARRQQADPQLVQLPSIDLARGFRHQVGGSLRLGKCNAVPDAVQAAKQHDHAVDA